MVRAGRLGVELPVAQNVVLAKLRCPEVEPLPSPQRVPASKQQLSKEQADPVGGRESSIGAARADDEGGAVDSSLPGPNADDSVDHLVAALQDFFRGPPRYASSSALHFQHLIGRET